MQLALYEPAEAIGDNPLVSAGRITAGTTTTRLPAADLRYP
jgi:hypothetical protein